MNYGDEKVKIIKVDTSLVEGRTRDEVGDLRGLADSLKKLGQIQPIVLEDGELRSGGRRVLATMLLESNDEAIRGLEPGEIRALEVEDLDELERLLWEFDENRQRKGFNKAEEALHISKIKAQMEEERGQGVPNTELAELLEYSKGNISMALTVADAVTEEGRKELVKENSIAGAYRKLKSTKKLESLMKRAEEREKREGSKDWSRELHCGDALEWIEGLPDESVDFIHFDPPWGIGIDSYDRQHNYGDFKDDADTGTRLSEALMPHLYRVLREDTYMVVWFGIQFYQELYERLERAGFKVHPVPFIWYKTNKSGSQNDPTRTTLNVWEPFFLAQKGDPRMYTHAQSNMLEYPMPTSGNRYHFAQKDTDLLKDIIQRFSFGDMVVMDPTFGSGAALVTANGLGREILGCEKDEDNYKTAIDWLRRGNV